MKTEFYCNSSYEDRILLQFQFVEYRNDKLFFSVYLFEEAVHRKSVSDMNASSPSMKAMRTGIPKEQFEKYTIEKHLGP